MTIGTIEGSSQAVITPVWAPTGIALAALVLGRRTGVGLSLVAQVAALHRGRVWVEEAPAGGASFRVFLPAR